MIHVFNRRRKEVGGAGADFEVKDWHAKVRAIHRFSVSPDHAGPARHSAVKRWFRDHSSIVKDSADSAAISWVAGSGLEGAVSLRLTLELGPTPPAKPYTVRLHFAEPDSINEGERVFDVYLQRERVLESLDVVNQSGGSQIPITYEFSGVEVNDELHVELRRASDTGLRPILCGIEILRD